MAGKLSFIIGLGAGYVVGARSGRERYEQIAAKAQELWRDPRVQEKAGQAQQVVAEKAGQVVKEKAASATSSNGDDATSRSESRPKAATSSRRGSTGTTGAQS